MYRIEFWQDLLIGGELGGVCRCSSCVFSIVSTKFHLDREHRLFIHVQCAKVKVFALACSRISRRDRVGEKKSLEFFT